MYWNREKVKKYTKVTFLIGCILLFIGAVFLLYRYLSLPPTLDTYIDSLGEQGKEIDASFARVPAMPLTEEDKAYVFQDVQGGLDIQYAGQENKRENGIKVSLPKNYVDPIEIKLDEERTVTIKDNTGDTYTTEVLGSSTVEQKNATELQKILNLKTEEGSKNYLRYESERKSLFYAYQKDTATGERKMKHWTVYSQGTGEEKESYTVQGATIKKNDNGDINVYYQSEQDIKNEAVSNEVPAALMERAMKTLEKEGANNPNRSPDFVIPKPYFVDKDSKRQDLEWAIDEEKKEISLEFKVSKDQYPIALDPTLQFSLPGVTNSGEVIGGENANNHFGNGLAAADMNNDGKVDLIVGDDYATDGRVYIFYNDGDYAPSSANADIIIGGGSTSYFASNLDIGDFNADGKMDLVVSDGFISSGNVYIFYNDGSIPTEADNADVIISGDPSYSGFGTNLDSADLNADGRTDLVVTTYDYDGSFTGATYIFYNDGSYPTTDTTADVRIIGETSGSSNNFGSALTTGDFNADGKMDLAASDPGYSTSSGRLYIFYNDGTYPSGAGSADVIIAGNSDDDVLGSAIDAGDFNADGRTDLVALSNGYPNGAGPGAIFIFYNDGSYPGTNDTADVRIDGSPTDGINYESLGVGDFNNDKRTDIAVATGYNGFDSYVYVLYNDGTYPSDISTADVIIKGEGQGDSIGAFFASGDFNNDGTNDLAFSSLNTIYYGIGHVYLLYSQNGLFNTNKGITGQASSQFGISLASSDLNGDGRTDLIVGGNSYTSATGRAYIFYNDGSIPTTAATADVTIAGETTFNFFASVLTTGDLNSDGRIDLVIGARGYSSNTGRAYIFYNDGSIPTTAATADVIITGETSSNYFGWSLITADLNFDGKTDLTVGAENYSSSTGRAYIFYNDGSIPTTAATADVIITGEASSEFGYALTTGDLNSDGRIDLVVTAFAYSTDDGRAYIFYNDGSIPTTAATADVIITGNTDDFFGISLTTGDLNSDNRTDLIVGAEGTASFTGRAYIFYNDGSIPTTAATADVTITGEAVSDSFGISLTTGDLNSDNRADLIVGAYGNSSSTGSSYIFYNDGSYTNLGSLADIKISGQANDDLFGQFLISGDFNTDGKIDLVVGAPGYSGGLANGQIYFYEGKDNYSWTLQEQPLGTNRVQPNVAGEEVSIYGELGGYFGTLASGDVNSDGKIDLIVGDSQANGGTGRVYIFYNDGNYSNSAINADVIITGTSGLGEGGFGSNLLTGDFNSDSRTDIAVSASVLAYENPVLLFYNDGNYPNLSSGAEVALNPDFISSFIGTFGRGLAKGDFNNDGRIDIVISAPGCGDGLLGGCVEIFYNDGSYGSSDVIIFGEAPTSAFGNSLAVADFNADGKVDLAIGDSSKNTDTGKVYIIYNDGSYPTDVTTADVTITGTSSNDFFGGALASGDMNSDGRADLIVGATGYSSFSGRAYIFYNDGSIPTTAATADVAISGNATSSFGFSLETGDLNTDGRIDLIVGSIDIYVVSNAYIFYNDGSIPTTAATADVTIFGEYVSDFFGSEFLIDDFNADGKKDLVTTSPGFYPRGKVVMYTFNDSVSTGQAVSGFGYTFASGDFNADGKIDLVVGAWGYSSNTGRAYIFYNDGSIPTTAGTADFIITGESNSQFGYSFATGDFNSDGRSDLVIGALSYSSNTGRAYIFYNDGSIPTTAATADVTVTGEASTNYFGESLISGDFNSDGKSDFAVGAEGYSSFSGRAYIFYNDGSIPTTAATADIKITGETSASFGAALSSGDLNNDGRVDLVVGSYYYSTNTGRVYIFYNDGSIPTTAATADITITGETGSQFGWSIVTGDFNSDGRTDLATGAIAYSSQSGAVYIFYNDGSIPTTAAIADVTITGEASNNWFGESLSVGDLNIDGKTDLVVGADRYSSFTGRAYIFYNDGSYPTGAASADKVYTGEATNSYFGVGLAVIDINIDGKQDLIIGAWNYSSGVGRMYTFITETETTPYNTTAGELKGGSAVLKGSGELK